MTLFIFKTYAPLLLIFVYLVTIVLNYIIVDVSSLMCGRVIFYCRFVFHHILIFLVFSEYMERGGLNLSRSGLWPYKLARGLLSDLLELRVFGLRKRSQLPKSISLNFYLVRSKTKYWKNTWILFTQISLNFEFFGLLRQPCHGLLYYALNFKRPGQEDEFYWCRSWYQH